VIFLIVKIVALIAIDASDVFQKGKILSKPSDKYCSKSPFSLSLDRRAIWRRTFEWSEIKTKKLINTYVGP
jgi:hypothetical protein